MIDKQEIKDQIAKDRIYGCMVGGAVGDALGYAVEFDSWSSIERKFGPKGISRFVLGPEGKALISDDTQMSLYTANGILRGMTRGFLRGIMARPDHYCQDAYLNWLDTQDALPLESNPLPVSWLNHVPNLHARRSPGNTCLSALTSIARGEEVSNNSCGCGGVMRTAPIALIYAQRGFPSNRLQRSDLVAAETARITHKHPLSFIPSAILNHILMQIMLGVEGRQPLPEYYVEDALKAIPDVLAEEDGNKPYKELWPQFLAMQRELIIKAMDLAHTDIPDYEAIEQIGGGWTGHEALAIAIYSTIKHCDSFEEAIISSVNHSGDSDSTGSICGNITGCLLGRNAIPEYFTENLELLEVIEEMAEDIFTGCVISRNDKRNTPEKIRWKQKYVYHHWSPDIRE